MHTHNILSSPDTKIYKMHYFPTKTIFSFSPPANQEKKVDDDEDMEGIKI